MYKYTDGESLTETRGAFDKFVTMDTDLRKTTNENVLKKSSLQLVIHMQIPFPPSLTPLYHSSTAIKELIQPTKTPSLRQLKNISLYFHFFKLKEKVINIKFCKIPVIRIRMQVLSHSWGNNRRVRMMGVMG